MGASRFTEPEPQQLDKRPDEGKRLHKPYIGEEIFSIPEPEWLLPGFVSEGGFTVIAAEPGNGKSLLMQDWANVLAAEGAGWSWNGRDRSRQAKVGYIMAEGQGGLPGRVLAWQAHRKSNHTPPVAYFMYRLSLWHRPDTGLTQEQQELVEWVKENELDVLFVDTLAATFGGGNENMQQDMNQYTDVVQKIQETGCAVVVAHHLAKNGSIRGSTVLTGDADTIVALEAKFDDGFLQWVWMHCYKQKDGPAFYPMLLKPKQYRVKERGKTSVVLEYGGDEKPTGPDSGSRDYRAEYFRAVVQNPGLTHTKYRSIVGGSFTELTNAKRDLLKAGSIREEDKKLYPKEQT